MRIYRHYCIQYTPNENQSSQSVKCQIQHTEEARKMLVFRNFSFGLFDQKEIQGFFRTFLKFQQNSRTFQDVPGLFSNSSTFYDQWNYKRKYFHYFGPALYERKEDLYPLNLCISKIYVLQVFALLSSHQWSRFGVSIVNFEHISHLALVFVLLNLNM